MTIDETSRFVKDASSGADGSAVGAMLGVEAARLRVIDAVGPLAGVERVPLSLALGRVVAEPVRAAVEVPPADNSSMDGFAFRLADLEASGGTLPLRGRAAPGHASEPLGPGEATRIFTGAVVPRGADTVVRLEHCEVTGESVRVVNTDIAVGDNIRRAGEDVTRGAVVLSEGHRIRPPDLGVAASVGTTDVPVRRLPRVAVLVTGDELVEPGRPLADAQIYDSNGAMMRGLLDWLGCEPRLVGRTGDTLAATRDAMRAATTDADLIVTHGGVSVGHEDHVKNAVQDLGRLDLWKVAVKPGKPVGFGEVLGVPWLGLPGNPVSGFVTFLLFGAPLIRRLQGREPTMPAPLHLPAGFRRERAGKREEYVRVRVQGGRLIPHAHQGAGVLSSAAWGDGLARIDAGTTVQEGDGLPYYSYASLWA